jgi:hypothetical protein
MHKAYAYLNFMQAAYGGIICINSHSAVRIRAKLNQRIDVLACLGAAADL